MLARAELGRAGLLLAAAVALVACTGDDRAGVTTAPPPSAETAEPPSPPTTGGSPPAVPPTDPAGDLTSAVLTVDTALSLFAAGYAPLPGVEPASAPPADGGAALRTVLGAFDDLPAEQRAVITRTVAPAGRPLDEILGDRDAGRRDHAAARIVAGALDAYSAARGRPLPNDVRVTLAPLPYAAGDGTRNFPSPAAVATAIPVGDGADPYAECRIRLNRDHPGRPTDPAVTSWLAQEAYHCLQFEIVPFAAAPQWVVEGAAAYAGEEYAGGSRASARWWRRWIEHPERPLGRRTHDAIGFFALLAGATNPYEFADALLTDPSTASVRRRLAGTDVFDRWGLSLATEPRWGRRYRVAGPGAPGHLRAPRTTVDLGVDQRAVLAGGPVTTGLAAAPVELTVPGDVLVVTADPGDRGGLRFGDGQEAALPDATQAWCVRRGGCTCPGQRRDSSPATPVESRTLFIGVGPSPGGGPALAARSLGRWCQEMLVPPPPTGAVDQCLVRSWTSRAYVAPSVSGAAQAVRGGDGALIEFRADRTVTVDMNATTPAEITLTGPTGATVTTTVEYRGAGSGTWSAANGVVDVAGVDPSSFTVRVRVESSAQGVLADATLPPNDVRLAGIAGLLGTGRYVCTAASLTITHVVPGVGGEAGFELTPT